MNRTLRTAFVLMGIVGCMVIIGCSTAAGSDSGEDKVDIRGTITNVSDTPESKDILGTILVEGSIEEDTSYDKASIKVTDDTEIYEQTDGRRTSVKYDKLTVGTKVEVQFTGPVAESYPVQTTAGSIVILAEK